LIGLDLKRHHHRLYTKKIVKKQAKIIGQLTVEIGLNPRNLALCFVLPQVHCTQSAVIEWHISC